MQKERADEQFDPRPESAMGGTSDMGAYGGHPASGPRAPGDHRPATPDDAPGDAAVERRRGPSADYRGPERRIAKR